jgi:hypothetical protein
MQDLEVRVNNTPSAVTIAVPTRHQLKAGQALEAAAAQSIFAIGRHVHLACCYWCTSATVLPNRQNISGVA